MHNDEFQFTMSVDELPDGGRKLVEINDSLVLVFRIGDQFFAIDDICTHDGGTLADGEQIGFEIKCPRHGARFDIRTGQAMCMPATKPTKVHECQVRDNQVLIKLSEP